MALTSPHDPLEWEDSEEQPLGQREGQALGKRDLAGIAGEEGENVCLIELFLEGVYHMFVYWPVLAWIGGSVQSSCS
jgi:hypothetical protein